VFLDSGGVQTTADIGIHPQNRQALCDFTEYWQARRSRVFKFMSTGLFKNASLLAVLIAAVIYLTSILSPPSLMDDSDAVEAQIARTMLTSGDFVTARLDGVIYLEKTPLPWWLMDIFYKPFGFRDWAARIPTALSAIGLAWLTAAFGVWAFGRFSGFYAGLIVATCVGLWLFTRIVIPDVELTLVITLAMWAFLRVLDEEEKHPTAWAMLFYASLGLGLLLKSLVGVVFPIAAAILFLLATGQLFSWRTWKKMHPISGTVLMLLVAVPWHVLATLRNPPYFAWTLKSMPGHFHGFLWFFFINEQLLRFLNLRYPRDYDTVPRIWFWLFHLIWLFPWSVYLPAVAKLSFKPEDRAGRTRLLALCWIGFILVFFTFSTTQEYYSMPCYPAFALLLGCAMAEDSIWIRRGTQALAIVAGIAAVACFGILFAVRHVPTPGDITAALVAHPNAYKLSLGHMEDLTLDSFAYLRLPLGIAGIGFLVGAIGTLRNIKAASFLRSYLAAALMMVIFFQAARLAMVRFDPLLSSRDIARVIMKGPEGQIIVDHNYYWFSSIPFYTGRPELLLNGRINNLEYGSNAPNTPDVFIDDTKLKALWSDSSRYYLVAKADQLPRFNQLLGANGFKIIFRSGGKVLLTNLP
jgi:4-amino-4-deoxy-L-arabinose transferase-like glycosyltransferase